MPTLTLTFKEKTVGQYQVKKGEALTIGRRETNNIVIENLAVSALHAKIDSVDDGFLLTDLKSKNGSFVNKQPVSSHWLKHGDVIDIGKHTLVFAYGEGETQPESTPEVGLDQTMVMDTAKYREMTAKVPAKAEPKMPERKQPVGVLSFLVGGEGEVELSKKLARIGKKRSCDIVVRGLMVGQTAASISKRPNGYYLNYVEGISRPKVNGESVKQSVMLKEFDVIEIGSVKMQFVYK